MGLHAFLVFSLFAASYQDCHNWSLQPFLEALFFFKWNVIFNVYFFIFGVLRRQVVASQIYSLAVVHEPPAGVGFSCCRAEARGPSGLRS